jgi:hypothetical protein
MPRRRQAFGSVPPGIFPARFAYTEVDKPQPARKTMKDKRYTVVCIYEDNDQRYATDGYGPTPTDAVIDAIKTCRRDNHDSTMQLEVCAVFRGKQPIQDRTVELATERMPEVRCRATVDHKFTVVTAHSVDHVRARNAVEAEPGYGPRVAGIFRGHLMCQLADVDWDRVEAETTRQKKAA